MSYLRLKTDARFAISMAMGSVGLVLVMPFAIWRLFRQEFFMALVDLSLLAVLFTGMVWSWRGGPLNFIANSAAVVVMVISITLSVSASGSGYYWLFVAVLTNAILMTRAEIASILSLCGMLIALLIKPADSVFHQATIVATLVMTIMFSYVFASRVENQRKSLESQALRDPLTGLDNRRAFEIAIEALLHDMPSKTQASGLVLLDVDNFKSVNDKYGHQAGDKVLRGLAGLLNEYLRATESAFRLGGEEFVLLLPGTDAEGLRTRMENLRGRIEANLRCQGQIITASIGASQWQPGDTATSWLRRADAAMYRAKREGRNRVIVHELSGFS